MPQRFYAVAMGDLVAGPQAADRSRLHALFNLCVREANQHFGQALASPLTITLGDEVRGLSRSLESAFLITRFVRLRLMTEGLQTRVVTGSVQLETELDPDIAWNMMGTGLAEAREKLADKEDFNCYRFSLPEHEALELALNAIGSCLTRVETGWTETQLAYVAEVLSNPDGLRRETARNLGISQNTLYKVLRSADFRFYNRQLETVQSALRLHAEAGAGGWS